MGEPGPPGDEGKSTGGHYYHHYINPSQNQGDSGCAGICFLSDFYSVKQDIPMGQSVEFAMSFEVLDAEVLESDKVAEWVQTII